MLSKKLERINSLEEQIKKLENQKKSIMQKYKEQERKERTHRLCNRGGLLESIFPDTLKLTDGQLKVFLEKTLLTDYAKHRYNDAISKNSVTDNGNTPSKQANSQPNQTMTSAKKAGSFETVKSEPTPQTSIYVEDDEGEG